MRINDAVVRAATTGTIWDSDLKGFGIRTGKQSKTFIVDIGRGRRKKLGRFNPPFFTSAKARDEAAKLLAEKQLGKIIPKHTAFDDAKKEFLEDCASRLRPSTLALYKWHLGRFSFDRKSVGDITGRDIIKVLKKQTTSNREHLHRVSATFFSWCVRQEIIDRSPMEKMGSATKGKSRERVLTEEELRKIYRWALKLDTPPKRFIWLMLRFGQRPGETIRFQRDFIQPDRITLPSTLTGNKMGREHVFPITKEDYDTILTFPVIDDAPYLFPAARSHVRGKPCTTMALNQDFRQTILTETKTDGWVPNDCRRTLSTYWSEKLAIDPHLTERMLNHVSGTISGVAAVYNRARYVDQLRPCVERWEQYLSNLIR
jgi:integrase